MMNVDIGLANQFKAIIIDKDGNERFNSGWHKNMILDSFLKEWKAKGSNYKTELYNNKYKGVNNVLSYLHIGEGNSTPVKTQTQLDRYIASASSSNSTWWTNNFKKHTSKPIIYNWCECKFVFTDTIKGKNLTEIGLCASDTASAEHPIVTRALIRDANGQPTTIALRAGEQLVIIYKVYAVLPSNEKLTTMEFNYWEGGVKKSTKQLSARSGFLLTGHRYSLWTGITYDPYWLWQDETFKVTNNVESGGNNFNPDGEYSHYEETATGCRLILGLSNTSQNIEKVGGFYFRADTMTWYCIFRDSANKPLDKDATTRMDITIDFTIAPWNGNVAELT